INATARSEQVSAAQEVAHDREAFGHRLHTDLFVSAVGKIGIAGAEVDRIEAVSGELSNRRPRLLGLEGQVTGATQPLQQRVLGGNRRGGRVALDAQLPRGPDKLAQPGLRLNLRAVSAVSEVQPTYDSIRDHVVRDPASYLGHAQ